jgi:hypothetical protein
MKLLLSSPVLLTLLSYFLVNVTPLLGQTPAATTTQKIPFHGKVQAVDTSAQTITIASKKAPRVFHLTSTTKITDGSGAPSTLSSATVGEDVGGSYEKASMSLYSLRIGAKTGSKAASAATPAEAPAAAPAPSPAPAVVTPPLASTAVTASASTPATTPAKVKKQSFSGKVVSVDAAANTLVVHGKTDQTFALTPTSKITGADHLTDVTVGTKVSGTYSKSADGATLTVYTLKVTAAK